MALGRSNLSNLWRRLLLTSRWPAALVAATCAIAAGSGEARAQAAATKVSGTGKGIVGTALLGGEVVMIGMGAFGVEATWPYLVFGGAGMVAGGVGGWAIESAGPPAELPVYLLAGGMALVIPTVVVVLNATAYNPPEVDTEEPIKNEPAPEAPKAEGTFKITSSNVRLRRRAAPPPRPALGLLDIDPQRVALGLPAPEIRPLFTQDELFRFGVTQGQEYRFPIVRATF